MSLTPERVHISILANHRTFVFFPPQLLVKIFFRYGFVCLATRQFSSSRCGAVLVIPFFLLFVVKRRENSSVVWPSKWPLCGTLRAIPAATELCWMDADRHSPFSVSLSPKFQSGGNISCFSPRGSCRGTRKCRCHIPIPLVTLLICACLIE